MLVGFAVVDPTCFDLVSKRGEARVREKRSSRILEGAKKSAQEVLDRGPCYQKIKYIERAW